MYNVYLSVKIKDKEHKIKTSTNDEDKFLFWPLKVKSMGIHALSTLQQLQPSSHSHCNIQCVLPVQVVVSGC